MKLAAMQPYFFPYLGQFDLINQVDMWIVYDPAQYIRHGWVNRNRVLHPLSGWQYIVVPLKHHSYTTPINQVMLADAVDWKRRIFRQLEFYRSDAPYYGQVIAFLEECLCDPQDNLARLNIGLFRGTCRLLGIETPIHVFSEMNLAIGPARGPEELALSLSRAVAADEYMNPPGGAGLYHHERFAQEGIKLTIQSFTNMTYDCGRHSFEPALSILDVLMWNSPEQIKHYLDTWRCRQC